MLRLFGAINNSPSLGYSMHVQVATIARFGTLLAFPLIALQIETGVSNKILALIPVLTYGCLAIILLILSKNTTMNNSLLLFVFKILAKISKLDTKRFSESIHLATHELVITKNEKNKIVYFGTFAFLFTSSAFFITSIIANQFLDFRTTIIQCTPFISSIGTLMSVVYFDPTLSQLIDKNPNSLSIIMIAWKARIYGSLIICLLFTLFQFIL